MSGHIIRGAMTDDLSLRSLRGKRSKAGDFTSLCRLFAFLGVNK